MQSLLVTGGLVNVGGMFAMSRSVKAVVLDSAVGRKSVEEAITARHGNEAIVNRDLLTTTPSDLPYRPKFIIHCAAIVDPQVSGSDARARNLRLTEAAINLAKECKSRFIFVSTTSVWGRLSMQIPAITLTGGATEYSHGKLEEEKFVRQALPDAIILRLGSVYGATLLTNTRTAINRIALDAWHHGRFRAWEQSIDSISPHALAGRLTALVPTLLSMNPEIPVELSFVSVNVTLRSVYEVLKSYIPELKLELEQHPNSDPGHLIVLNSPQFNKFLQRSDLEEGLRSLRQNGRDSENQRFQKRNPADR